MADLFVVTVLYLCLAGDLVIAGVLVGRIIQSSHWPQRRRSAQ